MIQKLFLTNLGLKNRFPGSFTDFNDLKNDSGYFWTEQSNSRPENDVPIIVCQRPGRIMKTAYPIAKRTPENDSWGPN